MGGEECDEGRRGWEGRSVMRGEGRREESEEGRRGEGEEREGGRGEGGGERGRRREERVGGRGGGRRWGYEWNLNCVSIEWSSVTNTINNLCAANYHNLHSLISDFSKHTHVHMNTFSLSHTELQILHCFLRLGSVW